jgi:ATP-dependent DNA ligase
LNIQIFETKLDGYRAIAVINSRRSSALVSQSLTTRTNLSEGLRGGKQAKVRSTILDGQIVALDDSGHTSVSVAPAMAEATHSKLNSFRIIG